jgi:hypothetical protein
MTSIDERRRRLEGVQHALLVLSDGQAHTGRELFDREQTGERGESWQYKALSRMHDIGLVSKVGAPGLTRRYRLAPGASIDGYLLGDASAIFIWDTGDEVLHEQPKKLVNLPEDLFDPVPDDETEGPATEAAVEQEQGDEDAMTKLLSKLFTVLESFDGRLKTIDEQLKDIGARVEQVETRLKTPLEVDSDELVESMKAPLIDAARVISEHLEMIHKVRVIDHDNVKQVMAMAKDVICESADTNEGVCMLIDLLRRGVIAEDKIRRVEVRRQTTLSPLMAYATEAEKKGAKT